MILIKKRDLLPFKFCDHLLNTETFAFQINTLRIVNSYLCSLLNRYKQRVGSCVHFSFIVFFKF